MFTVLPAFSEDKFPIYLKFFGNI